MKKNVLLIIVSLFFYNVSAQQILISDSATISLLTCSPGEEVYAKFGHTAIRIKDPISNFDLIFNYGIFNFETDNFYYKFIKGETDYQLGITEASYFFSEYEERNSMVWEQKLNLNTAEKRNLINNLLINYEPQNRIYRYNFIFDNCSSRPRDKILNAIINARNGYVKFQPPTEINSFRNWIGNYVGTDTWLKFGIDIIFGIDADKTATQNESMFLPEVLMNEFSHAEIVAYKGDKKSLLQGKTTVVVQKKESLNTITSWFFKPLAISIYLLLVGILITLWDIKRKLHYKLFDTFLLIITGIGGCVVFYLMFFSAHPLVKSNLNLLWLNPLNLVVAVVIWIRHFRKPLLIYQMLNMFLLVSALLAFSISSQTFNVASFPIMVLLLMRSTHWFARAKRRIFHNEEFRIDREFFQSK